MPAPVSPDQISYRKKIGRLGSDSIFEVGLIGGLVLVMKSGEKKPLGAGPHRAVARHIAQAHNPEIVFTELSKSDYIEPRFFESMLPRYEALTAHLGVLAMQE